MNTRFVDIHLLQPLPYSCLNRDDLGSPKTLFYGGVERARISSQSWKRVTRLDIEQTLGDPAMRTRRLVTAVAERLEADGWDREIALQAGRQILVSAGKSAEKPLKTEEDGVTSSALLYLPRATIDDLAALAGEFRNEIAAVTGQKKPPAVLPTERVVAALDQRSATINLFGRMLAELPQTEVDGAVQVAHAFTVHATSVEVDFFTAVDDLNPADTAGSAHMSSAQYVTGVFYRYASIGLDELLRNVNDDSVVAHSLVRTFLAAFLSSMPTGKRNSTAPNTLPELAYLTVRSDRPMSFAGAFETPVRPADDGGYSVRSAKALDSYAGRMHTLWGRTGLVADGHATIHEHEHTSLGDQHRSYAELIDHVVDTALPAGRA